MEAGRPPILNEELTAKIRTLVLAGEKYKDIQATLDINPSTWDTWVYKDYQGFRTNLRNWDNEMLVNIAKGNLYQLLNGDDDRIRADLTKFTLETLGRIDFSKRIESDVTSGGKPLFVPSEILEKNNIDASTHNTEDSSEGQTQI